MPGTMTQKPKLTLIGAEHSFFSAKARSYLRYKGLQGEFWQEALATLDIYKNAILPLVGVNFIPILLVHDENGYVKEAIQDTSLIIDYVEKNFPTPSIHPTTPKQRFMSYLFELFCDEWLKMPAMHYRWSFLPENERFLIHEWGLVNTPHGSTQERIELVLNSKAKGPSFNAMKQTLPLLGITETTAPQVEASFLELIDALEAHFQEHYFLLGDAPCLGDFSLIGPFYAHLYRDPKPSGILRSRAPAFCEYIERMNGVRPAFDRVFTFDPVSKRLIEPPYGAARFGRVYSRGSGKFLPDDAIPRTLLPILSMMFKEHIPVLLSTCNELKRYLETKPVDSNKPLPRTTGFHDFSLRGATGKRLAYPYDIWMLQRCLDHSVHGQPDVTKFIEQFPNGKALLDANPLIESLRLRIVNFKLYLDPMRPGVLVQSRL